MILLADSGSTKTDWSLTTSNGTLRFSTQGINPFIQSEDFIVQVLSNELLSEIDSALTEPLSVYFYGAGCTPSKCPVLKQLLSKTLATRYQIDSIFVSGDLLGAARSLCNDQPGIACILGTGANSCYFDGKEIVKNVSPLGYILGDEGSGAYIGKRLVGNCIKEQFSPEVCKLFFEENSLSVAEIIEKVYRQPMPNRFLGGLSQFCKQHIDIPEIEDFVIDCFSEFFKRNILNYDNLQLPVHFVGSIAWAYENQLRKAAQLYNLKIGIIVKNPMDAMIAYHCKSIKS